MTTPAKQPYRNLLLHAYSLRFILAAWFYLCLALLYGVPPAHAATLDSASMQVITADAAPEMVAQKRHMRQDALAQGHRNLGLNKPRDAQSAGDAINAPRLQSSAENASDAAVLVRNAQESVAASSTAAALPAAVPAQPMASTDLTATRAQHPATITYVLAHGETVQTVADKYQLTLVELEALNASRAFSKPFIALSVGDHIDVPRKIPSVLSMKSKNADNKRIAEDKVANGAVALAGLLSSKSNKAKAAVGMARAAVTNEVSNSAQQWLNQFGTARLQLNLDDRFNLNGSALDMLIPLHDSPASLLFTQIGARSKEKRITLNLGAGIRTFHKKWMYGLNTFVDNDIIGMNQRIGVGAEAWTDYLKLSTNSYFRTTNWHQSLYFPDYKERPADGYDLRAEAYLPAYPQLGGKLMYEQYHGEEVALFAMHHRRKDPRAFTAELNYTPIPLLTFAAERRMGGASGNDYKISVQLNLRLGASWRSQFDPTAVYAARTLAGSRYDLVERNNNIVLDFQKQELIRLALPEQLTGTAGYSVTLTAQVAARYGLARIDWNSPELAAAGGTITPLSANAIAIKLPPHQAGPNSSNVYPLSAVAYDSKGNASKRAITQVSVTAQDVSVEHSQASVFPETLPADGRSTAQLTLILKDENDQPITGVANQLTLALRADPNGMQALRRIVPQSQLQATNITETSPGEYTAILTAGTEAESVLVTITLNGQALPGVKITLTQPAVSPELSLFTATPETIIADADTTSTLTFTARDANNTPIQGLAVTFGASGVSGITVGPVSEIKAGVYTASLTGARAGKATIVPYVGGVAVDSLTATVSLIPAIASPKNSSFAALPETIVADNTSASTLTFTARDANNNPIHGLAVTFGASGVSGITVGPVSEIKAGVYTASLTGARAGKATIVPQIDGAAVGSLSATVSLIPAMASLHYSSFAALPETIPADNTSASTLTFTARDANNNPIRGLAVTFGASGVSGITVGPVSESLSQAGVYTAALTGIRAGKATIIPQIDGAAVGSLSATVSLIPAASPDYSWFAATPGTIVANNSASTLLFIARDSNNHLMHGLTVTFGIFGVRGITVGPVSESKDGFYSAKLTGSNPGKATIVPQIDGLAVGSLAATVTVIDHKNSTFTASQDAIFANGVANTTLTFTAKDPSNNPIRDLDVSFGVNDVTGTTVGPVTETDGVYTASLSGVKAGIAAIRPRVAGKEVAALSANVTLLPEPDRRISNILVNGAVFDLNSGFPKTGFDNARFQIRINGDADNNAFFNWSSNQEWAKVDASGNVQFYHVPNSPSATITAELKAGGMTLSYVIAPNSWFVSYGSNALAADAADNYCQKQGYGYHTPSRWQMTNASLVRSVGTLWGEWGRMDAYPGSGWIDYGHWLSEPGPDTDTRYYVHLRYGTIGVWSTTSVRPVACVRNHL